MKSSRVFQAFLGVVIIVGFFSLFSTKNLSQEAKKEKSDQVASTAPKEVQERPPEPPPAIPRSPQQLPQQELLAKKPPVSHPATNQELFSDLASSNGALAKEAAFQLIRRQESIEGLVEFYADNTGKLRQRSLWCLRRMGEPARIWFNQVLAHPDDWRPKIIVAVREILGEFEDEVEQQKGPEAKKTNDVSEPKQINEVSELLKRKCQLQSEIDTKKVALAKAEAKLVKACLYGNPDRGYISKLRSEIESLREEIRDLVKELKKLKT